MTQISDIADLLKKKGYEICNNEGIKVDEYPDSYLGLLKPAPSKIFRLKRQPGQHIATLYFDKPEIGANSDKWVLDVYEEDNFGAMDLVGMDLKFEYGIDVKVKLSDNSEK